MSVKVPVVPAIRTFQDVQSALNNFRSYLVQVGIILDQATADETYAPVGSSVTNGDDHDHVGGDGAPIDHATLLNLSDGDPHGQYQKESEKGIAGGYPSLDGGGLIPEAQIPPAIARDSEVTTAISDHSAAADPHTGYQKESEKNSASGYAGLDGASRTTKGVDAADDLIVTDAAKGLVLIDTQTEPHYWRVTVDNTGTLVISDLGTSKP